MQPLRLLNEVQLIFELTGVGWGGVVYLWAIETFGGVLSQFEGQFGHHIKNSIEFVNFFDFVNLTFLDIMVSFDVHVGASGRHWNG